MSRGYGRRNDETAVVSDGRDIRMSWQDAGDEPALLARNLEGVPVVVGSDRAAAGRLSERQFLPDVFVLDDGFQHRAIYRDLDIVAIDATRDDLHLLPAGALREPWSAISRAGIVVLTRTDQVESTDVLKEKILSVKPNIPVVETAYSPTRLRRLSDNERVPMEEIVNHRVVTVAGVANPVSFERTVAQTGTEIVDSIRYGDHHVFRVADLNAAVATASRHQAAWIITTEKDAVRIPLESPRERILALDIELEVVAGGPVLRKALRTALG